MMFQAITTRYIGPTNHRGSRVKATAEAGHVILSWDHALNDNDNHAKAAEALAKKFKWKGAWFGGGLPGGKGCVFVQTCPSDFGQSVGFTADFTTPGEG